MRLDPEQRIAGLAAGALLVTLFLPWYQKSVAVGGRIVEGNESAFGVFTFVEAAILLVALGVFALLYARGQRKPFHLPGGDGTVIFAAGLWSAVLLLWRVFDRPDVEGRGATVGITWGFFFAFLAAGFLAVAGWRIRAANRPEPPNPAAAPLPERRPRRSRERPLRPDLATEPPEYEMPARRRRVVDEEPPTEVTRREPPPEPSGPQRRLFDDAGEEPTRRLFDDPAGDEPTRRMP